MNFSVSSRVRIAESPIREVLKPLKHRRPGDLTNVDGEDFALGRGIFTGFSSLRAGSPDITEDCEFRLHGTGLARGLIALFRSVDS